MAVRTALRLGKAFLLVLAVLAGGAAGAYARTVRVPSFKTFEFLCDDPEPLAREYYEDYFSVLARHCGWTYSYAEYGTLESFDRLKSGDLDLVCDIAYTQARVDEGFIYSKFPCLTTRIFLVALGTEKRFNNSNWETLDGAVVGYAEGDPVQRQLLEEFAGEHGLRLDIRAIPYAIDIGQAIADYGLDLCMTTRMAPTMKEKIVYSFGVYQLYFAATDADLMAELDEAVDVFFAADPLFLVGLSLKDSLLQSFLADNPTAQEQAYIAEHNPIAVLDDDHYRSLSDKVHVKEDFWERVSGLTGTTFVVQEVAGSRDGVAEPCIYEVAEADKFNEYANLSRYTDTFYIMNVSLVCAPGIRLSDLLADAEPGAGLHPLIAITPDMLKTLPYFKEKLQAFDFRVLGSQSSCLQEVAAGGCAAALINSVFLQQRYKITEYRSLRDQHLTTFEVPMCMAVNMPHPEVLVSILNRAFAQLPYDYYMETLRGSGIYIESAMSAERLFNWVAVGLLLLLSVLALYSLALVVYHNKKLRQQINEDPLTGLLSLAGFEERAGHLFHQHRQSRFLLSEINVRDFSFVNRIYGSHKGDSILRCIASSLRTLCAGHDVALAHGYADSFYVLQRFAGDEHSPLAKMEEMQAKLQEQVGQQENVHLIIKSGNVVCSGTGNAAADIKDNISKAAYARRTFRDSMVENFSVYNAELRSQREKEEQVESSIETAIKNREFVVLYQPKIDLQTGKICGAEALVRWRNQSGGLIPPSAFLPVLEKNGLVGKLDMYVYRCVFSYLYALRQEGMPLVPVSMNMSRLSHSSSDFVESLNGMCREFDVPKEYIELEIEERFAGAGDDFIRDLIHRLHAAGYTVSMDDFGSGQSSLNMLSEMPVDIVKLDQRFLYYADYTQASQIILGHIIKMVNELGKVSLCEGVETESQAELLRGMGCRIAQGFYYARPLSEEDFKRYLIEHL